MRFIRIVGLFLTLAVSLAAQAQQQKRPRPTSRPPTAQQPTRTTPAALGPPQMTSEKAFYYFVAMRGFGKVSRYGAPDELIEMYGKAFDAGNYSRAMADEFERSRYKEGIRARIVDEAKKIDYSQKFTYVAQASLREYSFESHSFPVVGFPENKLSISNLLKVTVFGTLHAVNRNDFNWSIPMSEPEASAFVKSRANAGTIDRSIVVRVTFSPIPPIFSFYDSGDYGFSSFIYSVEAYADQSLTMKLGVVPKINLLGPSTPEEWRLVSVAAQTATKEIGKYRYKAEYRDVKLENPSNPRPQLFGTLSLPDVGFSMLDEHAGARSEKQDFRFYGSNVTTISRGKDNDWNIRGRVDTYYVICGERLEFETEQERDRFFADLSRAFQDWKTKYARFQFAAGQLTFN